MKRMILAAMVAICAAMTANAENAEDGSLVNMLSVDGRLVYNYQYDKDLGMSNDNTGFKGQHIYLLMAGDISKNVSYFYRQRFDNIGGSKDFFDATEILNLTWKVNDWVSVSGGKQVVALGGFEYNTAPIDLYYKSAFWWGFSPYELGASVAFNVSKNDNIMLQVNNSSFRYTSGGNTYGLNLLWSGRHGMYESYWSGNMTQYKTGKDSHWLNFVILGNRFHIGDMVDVDVDLVNRTQPSKIKIAKDYSVMSKVTVRPIEGLTVHGKFTRDYNDEVNGVPVDMAVATGTNVNTVSGGVEYEAIKGKPGACRVFATGAYTWYPDDKLYNSQTQVQAGVKFSLDILGGLKK